MVTVRTSQIRFAATTASAGLLACLALVTACDRGAGPPAPPAGEAPVQVPLSDEAPIRALYLCANRFVLLNEHPFAVRVAWRIQGTDEHGELTRAARQQRLFARQIVWLNLLLRFDRFEPRAGGVRALLPHVDRFLPVHNLASLADLATALRSAPAPRR